jgi:hypothetical protein
MLQTSKSNGLQCLNVGSFLLQQPTPDWCFHYLTDRGSVGQCVLVSGSHLSLDSSFLSNNCGLLDVERPLWREDGSAIYLYNCFWALPEQSLSRPSHAELMAIFYCLIWDLSNLEGQVPVFISFRNREAQLYPRALGSLFVTSYD